MGRMDKIVVFGAGGLVGSAILRRLEDRGYADLLYPTSGRLDLRRQRPTLEYFLEHKPRYVFLAAAKVGGIKANDAYRADFLLSNLQIQSNVFESAFETGVERLLFLGSSCVYPKDHRQPLREEDLLAAPLEPTNEPYAVAKIAGLKLAESFRRQHGREFIAAMPTNVYGEDDNFHPEDSHVIPGLISRMHRAMEDGERTFRVWGTGRPRREFLYVDDLAHACVFLMERRERLPWHFVNVGTGTDVSVGELAALVAKKMGFEGELVFDPSAPDGMMAKRLDVSKMAGLGWRARTSLDEGLSRTVDFFKARASLGVRSSPAVRSLRRATPHGRP